MRRRSIEADAAVCRDRGCSSADGWQPAAHPHGAPHYAFIGPQVGPTGAQLRMSAAATSTIASRHFRAAEARSSHRLRWRGLRVSLSPPSWTPTSAGRLIARISRGRSGSWGFVEVRTPGLICRFCSLVSVSVRVGIVHTAEVGSSSLPSPTDITPGRRPFLRRSAWSSGCDHRADIARLSDNSRSPWSGWGAGRGHFSRVHLVQRWPNGDRVTLRRGHELGPGLQSRGLPAVSPRSPDVVADRIS